MNIHIKAVSVSLLCLGALLHPYRASAQGITTGTIIGTVVDPSGAVIPNAQIAATDVAKGTTIKTVSQPDGNFSFRAVPIGTYRLAVSAAGFSTGAIDSVVVVSGVTTDLKSVQLGISASEKVIVSGSTTPLLEVTESQVSTTFTSQALETVPIDNAFDTITEVVPGVVTTHGVDNFSNANGDNFSVNGQSGRYNNFEIDGQSNNDNTIGGPQAFMGNQDSFAELQIITNDYSAQYGRNAGAVVNYLTKSGDNSFHGSGFEFYQGQFLSSFENQEKSSIDGFCAPGQVSTSAAPCGTPVLPRSVENRFGGTLGGPIYRNKVFFFGSAYWDRQHTGASPGTDTTYTPTPAGLAALAAAFPGNPGVAALQTYGPYAVKTGNPIPVASTLTSIPVTGPGGVTATIPFAFVQRLVPTPFNDQEDLGRVDWQPTDRDRLFARYFYQTSVADAADGDIGSGGYVNVNDTLYSAGGDWTHTFSPVWVDQLRYSFQQATLTFQGGGFPTCTTSNPSSCPSDIAMGSGFDGFGLSVLWPQGRVVKVDQVQDNATWTHGNHTILFGGEVDYQNTPNESLFFYGGLFNYASFNNFLQQAPESGQSAAAADAIFADGNFTTKFTETDVSAYLQDDWKVTPTLTAHIGLRWEYFGPASNVLHDQSVTRESNPATAFWSTMLPLADRTVPAVQNYGKGYEPRLGLAWNPSFDSKLVVKAGYAINENPAFYNMALLVADSAPFVDAGPVFCAGIGTCLPGSGNISYSSVRALNLPSLPLGGDPRQDTESTLPANFRPPYTQIYTLAFDHQLGAAAVGEVRYVGNLTEHDFQIVDGNPFLLPVQSAFPSYAPITLCSDPSAPGYGRPNCNYSNVQAFTNGGWANYNGLQMNLTTRSLHGMTGGLSYTYSKSLDDTTDAFRSTFSGGSSEAEAQNPLNPDQGERGISGNSATHVVGAQFVYQLPDFVKSNGMLSRATNGFTLSGLYRYTSGQPYTPVQPITIDSNTGDLSYCDYMFNSVTSGGDTCRLVVSNKKAPLSTIAYLNPYTGPLNSSGSPTLGTPEYVAYESDGYTNSGAYNPGTPINPASAHWIIDNQAYANSVGNPYPGQERNTQIGDNFSELDATIAKNIKINERVNMQLSMAAYNALNQMYRGTPGSNLVQFPVSEFGSYNYTSGSNIPSATTPTGTRFILLGARVSF